ncbi:MAG: 16S rRNA (guanine(527)-N(7))-methyltransferase RsmG [Acetobacteraceae bacterium]|nr:16S rRNA (guanine(527)-N(7))-methyltransferase RsmG [Acetobacteraceae bacterium]
MKSPLPEVGVSRETEDRLDAYLATLAEWNRRINLVAAAPLAEWRLRHVEDSLQLLPLMPAAGVMADLGSGGGLPGLILAAALPEREMHLVESDQRKCAFLLEAARRMGLRQVKVHPRRIETALLPPIAVLTARALAPLAKLLPHAERLLAPDGIAVFPKGRGAEAEIAEARARYAFDLETFASRTDPAATILRLGAIRALRG